MGIELYQSEVATKDVDCRLDGVKSLIRVGRAKHSLYRAVFSDELRGGLFAYSANSGNVIRGVTRQGFEVGVLAGLDAELFLNVPDVANG